MKHKTIALVLSLALVLSTLLVLVSSVVASRYLIWEAEVLSSGAEVFSPVLVSGTQYTIEAMGMWWYNYTYNLAADAQYYTTDPSDSWDWGNNLPAPAGHSFLQIDGSDVNWGPFSNGDTGHSYMIAYVGAGSTVAFRVVDWIDGDYTNNICRLAVRIYLDITIGGYVVDNETGAALVSWTSILLVTSVVALPLVAYRKQKRRRDH